MAPKELSFGGIKEQSFELNSISRYYYTEKQ